VITNLGYFSLVLTFVVTLYGAGAAALAGTSLLPKRGNPSSDGVLSARDLKRPGALLESARQAMILSWPLLTITALCIITLLVTGQYQVEYVASVTNNAMPTYLKITALWGGQPGSLVFWAWLMAAFASAVGLRKWNRDRELLPWVIVVTMITQAFFISLVIFFENPFQRLWLPASGEPIVAMFQPGGTVPFVPADGQGLNPLLRHPGMVIHPPMLYLGFVSFVIPYAFAISALVTGRTDDRWIRVTRRWTLIAWLFLSLGLILGGRWAYDVLGWGGYWGWDPVEIAAFMPWLTGTAFLHSVMIQEKRGMLRQWNMVLIIVTYALVIFGTFLTRSGVLSSVHAFAQSAIGPMFFAFIGLTFIVSLRLLLGRWRELRGENQLGSMFSREALFLLNNLLFMGILVVCFWGVIFPLVSELFTGQKVTVGPPFYERATGPLWAGLLLLMGIAPLSAYGSESWKTLGRGLWKPLAASIVAGIVLVFAGVNRPAALLGYWLAALVTSVTLYEFWRGARARHARHGEALPVALWRLFGRNRRRYGGYVIHLGVVLMALGIIGIEMFQTETQGTLAQGEQMTLQGYTMIYKALDQSDKPDGRNVTVATVSVYRDGKYLGDLYPRRDYYYASQQPMTIPGVRSSLQDDFYVLLVGWEPIAEQGATFKIYHNPLVNFVWLGGLVFILGTLVAAWPSRELEPALGTVPSRGTLAQA
jgi:cytochrome c-type biogenesis protein CcmF